MAISVSPDEVCVISIGRGSRLTPRGTLSENTWALFGMSVRNLYSEVFFEGFGTGTWGGSSEESFTIIGKLSDGVRADLDDTLKGLAKTFYQDAIACTFGHTLFFAPDAPTATSGPWFRYDRKNGR